MLEINKIKLKLSEDIILPIGNYDYSPLIIKYILSDLLIYGKYKNDYTDLLHFLLSNGYELKIIY